ncbi:MAG: DGQHR domain-containing protein [Ignavibacterium sp.]|nr:DGQHR domain-containing protein [Ignavibacterium sp.]
MQQYVNLVDATFPTSIILSISADHASFNSKSMTMKVDFQEDVAKVLDGQHRIAGLENCEYPPSKFQLLVTIFVEMELEDQAIVFATINQTQTKVNKSLVADLFEFANSRSPQKTAHNIVRALNEKEKSPFQGKIKILGTANDSDKETITQATFVDSIIKYISKDKTADRDLYKRNKKPEKVEGEESKRYFLRNLFIDEKDSQIAQILWNYFTAVQTRWPDAWTIVATELVLNRSTGFISLMRFLKDCYLSLIGNNIGSVPSTAQFLKIFEKINIKVLEFNRNNYIPGSGGQSKMYNEFLMQSKLYSK